jgi:uncharacterized membrane protein YgdD (TMEM256/DUF423 family)
MKKFLLFAAAAGFSAVALGAFGAHALKPTLLARGSLETWHTASLYHLVHAVALLGVALATLGGVAPGRALARAADCWLAGTALFSGSLYFMALGGPRWLGPITPVGGVLLIAGWILVAFAARRPPA